MRRDMSVHRPASDRTRRIVLQPHPGAPRPQVTHGCQVRRSETATVENARRPCATHHAGGMRPPTPLPDELGDEFSVAQARRLGVSARRLRARDLARPFPGVRVRIHPLASRPSAQPSGAGDHPHEVARAHEAARLRALAARASPDQFFSHRSAAVLWGAPLPPPRSSSELHLATLRPNRAPRVTGVRGHSFMADRVRVQLLEGRIAVTDPASTWASLGELSVDQLVIAGDYFVRKYRQGVGRRDAGRQPLCRLDELAAALSRGRWDGMPGLRRALPLIREDSWSP